MNLVALLIAPLVVKYGSGGAGHTAIRYVVAIASTLVLAAAIWYSKSQKVQLLLPEHVPGGPDYPEAAEVSRIASSATGHGPGAGGDGSPGADDGSPGASAPTNDPAS